MKNLNLYVLSLGLLLGGQAYSQDEATQQVVEAYDGVYESVVPRPFSPETNQLNIRLESSEGCLKLSLNGYVYDLCNKKKRKPNFKFADDSNSSVLNYYYDTEENLYTVDVKTREVVLTQTTTRLEAGLVAFVVPSKFSSFHSWTYTFSEKNGTRYLNMRRCNKSKITGGSENRLSCDEDHYKKIR